MTRKTVLVALTAVAAAALLASYTIAEPEGPDEWQAGREARRPNHPGRVREAAELHERERDLRAQLNEVREQQRRSRDMAERGWRPRDPDMEKMHDMMEMLRRMGKIVFSPADAGLAGIGALGRDIPREPGVVIQDLEKLLKGTKTLGFRNAIRLTLKDLYLRTEQKEKAVGILREMIAENDAALSGDKSPGSAAKGAKK
jgi:hypothetical protein